MAIYGVAILAFCYFAGNFIGDMLGALLKVKANVGGVGFAMLFLILLIDYLQSNKMISKASEKRTSSKALSVVSIFNLSRRILT